MKINKLIVAGLLTLSSVATGMAQQVQWGVKAGYNMSSLSGAPEGVDAKSRSGFHVGGLAEMRAGRFALQPELLYSTEGAKSTFELEEDGFSIDSKEEIKLAYLNLPIMAKIYVVEGLNLQAGPQLGYLLSAESDYEFTSDIMGEPMSESGTEDIIEEAKRFAFGLNFGLGYDLTNNFFVQARYHLGLTGIVKEETPDEEPGVDMGDVRNSGFQFSLGYKF